MRVTVVSDSLLWGIDPRLSDVGIGSCGGGATALPEWPSRVAGEDPPRAPIWLTQARPGDITAG